MTADSFLTDELESDVLELLLAGVRKFVDERLIPNEAEVDQKDEISAALVQEMRDLGLFGLTIPQAYGGLGVLVGNQILTYRWCKPPSIGLTTMRPAL